ncbi:MAG TPA: DUF3618 domain-containing protein [Amycolatopsis sp.]|nr:DUF3618 domain-containing protein [Amycolatopsis sp.]
MTERATPTDAERARADRDVTREELAETLDALSHRLNVRSRAAERLDATIDQAATRIDAVSPPAAQKFRGGAMAVRRNPLPYFAAALGGVLTIRLLIRLFSKQVKRADKRADRGSDGRSDIA